MRIVLVCQRYYPEIGGIETHAKEVSERLVKKGHDVEVVCTDPTGKLKKNEVINGVRVTRFRSLAYKDAFFFAPQIYFYLRSRSYDCVHIHNYHALSALFAILACRDFIFTPHYHGGSASKIKSLLHKPYRMLGSYIFGKARKIVCVSKFEMALLKKHFRLGNEKLVHIPNGLNMEEFRDIKPMKKDNKTILYVGRLEKYKGVQYTINALTKLPGYRFEIIGRGPYQKELQMFADKLAVNDRIDWLYDLDRSELLSYYKSADVFVHLSRFEAYGITVAEALASGTSCIVAEGSALSDFIDGDGCIGVKYPIDIITLAGIIKSRKKIAPREMPDWENVTSELIKIYGDTR